MRIKAVVLGLLMCTVTLSGCGKSEQAEDDMEYGVFLSDTYEELPENCAFDTLVIDAQYYSEEQIDNLHENNGKVYSYLNIGSLENFRDYYDTYADLSLGVYENWEEEVFIDVTSDRWQEFIIDELAPALVDKGIDGFFIDNVDVYYNYPTEEIFGGVEDILLELKNLDVDVIINGGDVFLTEYLKQGNLIDIADGVNQESVYTRINFNDGTLENNAQADRQYFLNYLSGIEKAGGRIFIIEYTADDDYALELRNIYDDLGYTLYISDSVELD